MEHLGRATGRGVHCLLVVLDLDITAVRTALRIRELVQNLKIGQVQAVANKVRGDEDLGYLKAHPVSMPILTSVADTPDIRQAQREGTLYLLPLPQLVSALRNLSQLKPDASMVRTGAEWAWISTSSISTEIPAVSRFQSIKCGAVAGYPSFFTSRGCQAPA
ncbi:MAG: hypothetical protein ABIG68_02315 [Acidobacteriota bacterium]